MLLERRAMMFEHNGIPSGYTPITCIIRNASQVLETNLTPMKGYKLSIVVMATGTSVPGNEFIYANSNPPAYRTNIYINGYVYWYMSGYNASTALGNVLNKKILFETSGNSGKYTLVSTQQSVTINGTWSASSYSTTIKVLYSGKCKFYEMTYTDNNGNIISEMKPYLDNLGVPCVYDSVRKITLYDANGGTFGYER